jgi:hypothetical protein
MCFQKLLLLFSKEIFKEHPPNRDVAISSLAPFSCQDSMDAFRQLCHLQVFHEDDLNLPKVLARHTAHDDTGAIKESKFDLMD